jgi:large subunit ribosomal protein L18
MARSTRELRQRRHARIRRRLSGTAERPRVAVSRTNKHISAQIIDDVAGRTLAAASSVEADLKNTSGGNVDGAKAVASLLAERAKGANITTVVFDRGDSTTTAGWRHLPKPFAPPDWSFNGRPRAVRRAHDQSESRVEGGEGWTPFLVHRAHGHRRR